MGLKSAKSDDGEMQMQIHMKKGRGKGEKAEDQTAAAETTPSANGVSGGLTMPLVVQREAPAGLLNDFILETLVYKSMHDREDEVEKAHKSTFDWVFGKTTTTPQDKESSKNQIKQWLGSDAMGPIYWITGKPGSGKSTLIEYLSSNAATSMTLRRWASRRPVCRAGFFFWTSGSREQRSQTGLLRSLLHQCLCYCKELISVVFADLWARLKYMSTKERIKVKIEYTVEELIKAFHTFVDEASKTMNVCLFVDGLDEFEGDHNAIISLFKDLSCGKARDHIKMCLSSRPWPVFEKAFEHSVPNLKLQDLTYNDMYLYVAEKLRQNPSVNALLNAAPAKERTLVNMAVAKADGVFLWVRLAVERMLKLFNTSQGIDSLQNTLEALPGELDDLFSKFVFVDQTEQELEQTSNLYQLLRAREKVADFVKDDSSNALTVWELAFALRTEDDETALTWKVEHTSETFVDNRCRFAVAVVQQRFTGLLGLHARKFLGNMRTSRFATRLGEDSAYDKAETRVFYIHRTVRDWLVTADGIHDRLVASCSSDFDGHLRLLRSYVLRMKRPLEEIEQHRRLDEWWPDIALALTHARYIVNDKQGQQIRLINELNETLCWWWAHKATDPYDHWARNAFGTYEVRMKATPIWQPFLCLAVKFGLTKYVVAEVAARAKYDSGVPDEVKELQTSDSTPLLAYGTEFLCSRQKTIYPVSDPGIVEYLLKNKSRINPGPNHEYQDFMTGQTVTPWLMLLKTLRNARRRNFIEYYDIEPDGTKRWTSIVKLFLQAGKADANAVVLADTWDPEITAEQVLQLLEDTYGAVEIHETKELLQNSK